MPLYFLTQAFGGWECGSIRVYNSEAVEIIFLALYHTVNELGEIAFLLQGRSVTNHFFELWIDLLKSMLREHDQEKNMSAPMLQEYMEYAHVTIGAKVSVLSTLYFLGFIISEEVIASPEYINLSTKVASCYRLLNDLQSFKVLPKDCRNLFWNVKRITVIII